MRPVGTLLVVSCLLASLALATTAFPVPGRCPVCGERVTLQHIGSTNSFGGQDRDFFSRAIGNQAFEAAAVTSERCLYSGYAEDFILVSPDGGVEGLPLPEPLRLAILDGGALRSPTSERPLPGWARLDLIAQRLRLQDAGAMDLADAYLNAAWATRSSDSAWGSGRPRGCEAIIHTPSSGKTGERENPAVDEVRQARALIADGGVEGVRCATLLLRSHGEHEALLGRLSQVQSAFGPKAWAELGPRLLSSIDRERGYQRQALAYLRQSLAEPVDPRRRPVLLYLAGELERRLGHPAEARLLLQQARDDPKAEDWLRTYAAEQLVEVVGRR